MIRTLLAKRNSGCDGNGRCRYTFKMATRVARIAGLLFILFALQCSSIDNIQVETSSETTIPARSLVEDLVGNLAFLGFDGFDISQSEEFQNGGYTKDQIDSVRILSLQLEIVAPEGATFDFLESIHFFVEAEGLPRVQIAGLAAIADGQTLLDLDIDKVELLEYVVSPTIKITTEATGLRPEQETQVKADLIFDVDVNVDGSVGC